MSELWAGERLVLEKALPRYRRGGRHISVSAVPLGPGVDIWRTCRFLGSLLGAWGSLPGGFGIGRNHCRFGHIGWREKWAWTLVQAQGDFCRFFIWMSCYVFFFRHPASSGAALLAGTLLLRYCIAGYGARIPTWSLPSPRHVLTLSLRGAGDGDAHGGVGGLDAFESGGVGGY